MLIASSCGRTIVLADETTPPDQRAEISRTGGVRIGRIDGVDVEGSRFIVSPGEHSISLSSELDAKRVHFALEGVTYEDTCKVAITLAPGEALRISSRFKVDKQQPKREDIIRDFRSEVRLTRLASGETTILGSSECVTRKNCRRAKLNRTSPVGCD